LEIGVCYISRKITDHIYHTFVYELFSEQKQKQPSNEVVSQAVPKIVKPNNTGGLENKLSYNKVKADNVILPILMIACNRADAIQRSLDLVLK
jgi:hypothetical protein